MTLTKLLCGSIVAANVALTTTAEATTRITVFAEDYPKASVEQIATVLAEQFEKLRAGDRLIGIRAGSGSTIFDARVPNEPIYDTHKGHRDKLLMPAWTQATTFLKGTITAAPPAGGPPSQIDYPGSLERLAYFASEKPEVAFFGDARYFDDRQPQFSMVRGFPTDVHYARSRSETPFGVAGMEGSLEGMRTHVCMTTEAWINDAHKEGVQRSYALMAQIFGAELATFSADVRGCAVRFAEGRSDGARTFTLNVEDRLFGMVDVTLQPTPEGVVDPGQLTNPLIVSSGADMSDLDIIVATSAGSVTKGTLFLYDTDQEDGDAVFIVAEGYKQQVDLTNNGVTLDVPLTQGALSVVGAADGDGGITVGIRTGDGRTIISRKIDVGEALSIPIDTLK